MYEQGYYLEKILLINTNNLVIFLYIFKHKLVIQYYSNKVI